MLVYVNSDCFLSDGRSEGLEFHNTASLDPAAPAAESAVDAPAGPRFCSCTRCTRLFSDGRRRVARSGALRPHYTASRIPTPGAKAPPRPPDIRARAGVRLPVAMPLPAEARARRRRAVLLLVAGYICVAAAPSAADARSASNRPSSRSEGTVEAPSSAISPRRVEDAAGAAPPGPRAPRPLPRSSRRPRRLFGARLPRPAPFPSPDSAPDLSGDQLLWSGLRAPRGAAPRPPVARRAPRHRPPPGRALTAPLPPAQLPRTSGTSSSSTRPSRRRRCPRSPCLATGGSCTATPRTGSCRRLWDPRRRPRRCRRRCCRRCPRRSRR